MRPFIIVCLAIVALASDQTYVYCGRLIDGESNAVRETVTLTIDGDHFDALTDGFIEVPEAATLIDLREFTVLPGLIDMHVHLTGELSPSSYSERFFMNPADYAYRSVQYAERTLMAGFTTVRNLGDQDNISISLRDAIARGWVVGPRIYSAGLSIATTGGHADPTNGLADQFAQALQPLDKVIDGADEARKAVRQRYKDGADLIKITATGGVLSMAASGQNPQFSDSELRAIVETAKDYNFRVAVHAHGKQGIKRAILGGADSIEHGTYMDAEIMELMKQHQTWYVPTILAGVTVAERARIDGYFPEIVRPKAAAIGPLIQATFANAYAAGVKIAFGTDCGVGRHGENWRELVLMVEAGMPPMEALQAATIGAAELLGKESELGSIAPLKLADLIAVKGNPLDDIAIMGKVDFVMKAGKVFKDGTSRDAPAQPDQDQ